MIADSGIHAKVLRVDGDLAVGFWNDEPELSAQLKMERRFDPNMSASRRDEFYVGWQRAVDRSKGWAK